MDNKVVTELLQALIRIPSENNGVTGYENDVQQFFYSWLKDHDLDATLTYIEDIPGIDKFPGRLMERNMCNRPIVTARLKGNRPGKTILLLAHADTVPVGNLKDWDYSPFCGDLIDGNIYDENGNIILQRAAIEYDLGQEFWTKGYPSGYPAVSQKMGYYEEDWDDGHIVAIRTASDCFPFGE